MRTFTLLASAFVLNATAMQAQVVSTFEDLTLAHADTFYVNYSASGTDVGFNDGLAHFPCVYDTSFGGFWSSGFAYSNMTDSVTPGYTNQYSARTGIGYGGSANYVVAYCDNPITFSNSINVSLLGTAMGHPVSGFYITNNTYAYNSIKSGDAFSRPFHNGDWYKLTIRGFRSDTLLPDSVGVYLADYLFPDTTMNYVLSTWQWVNLAPLGNVDSLQFSLQSTDNGAFGMNTPAYFCIDNFTTANTTLAVKTVQPAIATVYPNPATDMVYVNIADGAVQMVTVMNMAGVVLNTYCVTAKHLSINTASLPAGMYILQLGGEGKTVSVRFVKQ